MALANKGMYVCVMPNRNQRLSWPILWIVITCVTYWICSIAVCVLIEALTRL